MADIDTGTTVVKCCGNYIPTEGSAKIDCTTVDFTIEVKNVCANSRVGIIAKVVDDTGVVYAIVCKAVDIPGTDCECVPSYTVPFTGVVVELGCSDPKLAKLKAVICHFNYLKNTCCC